VRADAQTRLGLIPCYGGGVARRLLALPTLLAALSLTAVGCATERGHYDANGRLRVVASTTQLADIARHVGGGAVDVHQLLRPNSDPHDYEPRPKDVEATADAAVVIVNGAGLDAWMDDVIANAGGHPTVVDAGAGRPIVRAGDPHWWHDPRNVLHAIGLIRAALTVADPAARTRIDRSATAYANAIRALDRDIARCIGAVPHDERKLVTDHDALGSFAARYGLRIVGTILPAQTSEAQPSARDVARLVALIRREHVRAVFPESSVNARLAEAIAHQTGASATLKLYGDSLGPAGSPGATYIGMERTNADRIVRGLTGGARGCPAAATRPRHR